MRPPVRAWRAATQQSARQAVSGALSSSAPGQSTAGRWAAGATAQRSTSGCGEEGLEKRAGRRRDIGPSTCGASPTVLPRKAGHANAIQGAGGARGDPWLGEHNGWAAGAMEAEGRQRGNIKSVTRTGLRERGLLAEPGGGVATARTVYLAERRMAVVPAVCLPLPLSLLLPSRGGGDDGSG
ncbi:hypothetical protein BU26DRAFT_590403 [Trematosphaeria pertusa]|uniref:Uncharacterized protein n=1 Tax=Trematosphaeria pertusa TaxID=390896 RepID=A0A6A6IQK7_9PLEO|nr:uncharacterized protein BU26DRAFT_590403 [Trematosphaeria pertusa]KAF2252062.1 hypothetical protein BU26DRAFT_590403 [Trematosphaeria pertusa]